MARKLTKAAALLVPVLVLLVMSTGAWASNDDMAPATWQTPSENIMQVLHAPQLPWVWTSPTGEYLFLADPILYPPLAELGAPMHKLAGMRVNPANNAIHGSHGGTSPRLVRVADGSIIPLGLPEGSEVHDVEWTVDGQRFALTVGLPDHMGLWVGSVNGDVTEIANVALNPLMGTAVSWLPDQKRLLVRRIPRPPRHPYRPDRRFSKAKAPPPARRTNRATCSKRHMTMRCSITTQAASWPLSTRQSET